MHDRKIDLGLADLDEQIAADPLYKGQYSPDHPAHQKLPILRSAMRELEKAILSGATADEVLDRNENVMMVLMQIQAIYEPHAFWPS